MNGWINKEKNTPHMLLDLGAGNPDQGEVQRDGFVHQDIQSHRGIDLVCDLRDTLDYIKPGQCKEVVLSHVLEHFTKKEGVNVVKMVYQLLEEGGQFTIFVPNFRWHAELLLTGNDEMAVHYAFGGQLDEFDLHKTGFTPKILKKLLEENGFKVQSITDQTSIACVALKTSPA